MAIFDQARSANAASFIMEENYEASAHPIR